jgi:hypothetical protein
MAAVEACLTEEWDGEVSAGEKSFFSLLVLLSDDGWMCVGRGEGTT